MSPLAVGVDLVSVPRIEASINRLGERFLDRIYTPSERALCGDKPQALAGRFAAKEAVGKALGTGLGRVNWRHVEILADPNDKPVVVLHGEARRTADALGLTQFAISLSHEGDLAIAFVVAM